MAKKKYKKTTKKFLGVMFAGLTFAFSFLVVDGFRELFGLGELNPLGKIIVGAGFVVGLGFLANKFKWLK